MSRLWIALGLVVAGCTTSYAGELTALLCVNGTDDDGDTLIDCEDPDCQVFSPCTLPRSQRTDGGAVTGTGGRDASPPSVSHDAGAARDSGVDAAVPPDADVDSDSGVVIPVDAGPPECMQSCAAPEVCIDGTCELPPQTPMANRILTLTSVDVPDQDNISRCYDDTCGPVPSPPFGFCTCPPDAFVRVERVRGSVKTEIGRTETATDTRNPDFSDMPIAVDVEPDDVLRLSVMDQDTLSDQLIFSCDLPSPLPESGDAQCMVLVRGLPFAIKVTLSSP